MGSGASRPLLPSCFRPAAAGEGSSPEPDETLGHSFYYSSSAADAAAETAFRTISGAAVSANSSAPPLAICDSSAVDVGGRSRGASFRSSTSFSALPIQLAGGGGGGGGAASGPLDRGFFLSGPIERGALSGPLEPAVPFSGPLPKRKKRRGLSARIRLQRTLSEKNRPWVFPLRSLPHRRGDSNSALPPPAGGNVEWAHGRAGEDRVHVVVSEEHRWLFVGIYDGFNGPEAPEFLVDNLYRSVFNKLEGLFWEEVEEEGSDVRAAIEEVEEEPRISKPLWEFLAEEDEQGELDFSGSGRFALKLSKLKSGIGSWRKEGRRIWFPKWRYDSDEKAKEVEEVPERSGRRRRKTGSVSDHKLVLTAMAEALEATELAYLEMTDKAIDCNPELALMGSCLLVVLMRDEDVYVMNVGDSRAIVAQNRPQEAADKGRGNGESAASSEEGIVRERGVWGSKDGLETETSGHSEAELAALQLSTDHSTSIEEEVLRIKEEHPDDNQCVVNDRVKGRLKVTRAFGAGYLKQPKWNNALLGMFRNEYIGTEPYISCTPSLRHYKLRANDQFLVLSSDGLYQYLSNEEVVLYVESFMERFPDGDPAQSLIEELLSRAAKKAGMDFHELLDIPQGDRRKYHDDVTVMVISLEGRIWKSSGKYV